MKVARLARQRSHPVGIVLAAFFDSSTPRFFIFEVSTDPISFFVTSFENKEFERLDGQKRDSKMRPLRSGHRMKSGL
jgi:hypothetical protein